MFALVRDMRLTDDDTDPPAAIEAWAGSRWTKHALLHELFQEFGLNSALIYAAQEVTPALWPWLPSDLTNELTDAGPLPDVHAFVRAQVGPDWMAIDATWPEPAASLGIEVNDHFEAGRDMRLACDPDELFHVPDDAPLHPYYEALVDRIVGEQQARRQRFFSRLASWIAEQQPTP